MKANILTMDCGKQIRPHPDQMPGGNENAFESTFDEEEAQDMGTRVNRENPERISDTSDGRQAEKALQKSEERYRSVVDNINIGIALISPKMEILSLNNQMTKWFPEINASEKPVCYRAFNNPPREEICAYCPTCKTLENGQVHEAITETPGAGETRNYRIVSSPVIDRDGNVMAAVEMVEDITESMKAKREKKIIQSQLLKSEKMASIGQIAAGVAHELNNPAGFVNSNLKTLAEYIKDINSLTKEYKKLIADLRKHMSADGSPPDVSDHIERISAMEEEVDMDYILNDIAGLIEDSQEGTERIRNIVQNLKDFAHPGEDKLNFVDINKSIDSSVNMVWNELKYKADVTKDYGDLPQVECYPQLMNQVFVNILVNAAQAIKERGKIGISTLTENGYVEIRINDTGCGIPEENISKIFDLFFTTKEIGKGTGLGMNVVYNIIEKHGGTIDLSSKLGKGTTFTIKLPLERKNKDG